jgi:hypothetical protein
MPFSQGVPLAHEVVVEVREDRLIFSDENGGTERRFNALSITPEAPQDIETLASRFRMFTRLDPEVPRTQFDVLVQLLRSGLTELVSARGWLRMKPAVRVVFAERAKARFGDYAEEILTATCMLAGAKSVSFAEGGGWRLGGSYYVRRLLALARMRRM